MAKYPKYKKPNEKVIRCQIEYLQFFSHLTLLKLGRTSKLLWEIKTFCQKLLESTKLIRCKQYYKLDGFMYGCLKVSGLTEKWNYGWNSKQLKTYRYHDH